MNYKQINTCCFCGSGDFDELMQQDNVAPLSLTLTDGKNDGKFMPYNVVCCKNCNSCQTKYRADLNIVYGVSHNDNYGSVKQDKFNGLSHFIVENRAEISGLLEIGSPHTDLAIRLVDELKVPYTIVEPNTLSTTEDITCIRDYFENVDMGNVSANAVIMSDVFEHFYEPTAILEKLKNSSIQYVYMNHPDFDYAIQNRLLMCLNTEHTFQIEHQYLSSLFENYGFRLKRHYNNQHFSLFLEFERINVPGAILQNKLWNINTRHNVSEYIRQMTTITTNMNQFMYKNPQYKYYIWPSSIHSITLFMFQFDYTHLTGILDNSPHKIGRYLYGYNLLCSSFDKLVEENDETVCIFIGGAGNYIDELCKDPHRKYKLFILDKLL